MRIETDRLCPRPFDESDAEGLYGYLSKQNVAFRRDASGAPIWHDTYLYAILAHEFAPE